MALKMALVAPLAKGTTAVSAGVVVECADFLVTDPKAHGLPSGSHWDPATPAASDQSLIRDLLRSLLGGSGQSPLDVVVKACVKLIFHGIDGCVKVILGSQAVLDILEEPDPQNGQLGFEHSDIGSHLDMGRRHVEVAAICH
ncbi:hypothetical protein BDV97DRAFT_368875 [Delphinella strobiligena]|nr:hypothetical protein BDV97DRAFT_368875 [Delphinella strobiligena]